MESKAEEAKKKELKDKVTAKKYNEALGEIQLAKSMIGMKDFVLNVLEGKCAVECGLYKEAEECFRVCLESKPNDINALMGLHTVYKETKQMEQELKIIESLYNNEQYKG